MKRSRSKGFFLNNENFCDVCLVLNDKRSIAVSKLYLSQKSRYFKNMFSNAQPSDKKHFSLHLSPCEEDALIQLLEYLYQEDAEDCLLTPEMYCLAIRLDVPQLFEKFNDCSLETIRCIYSYVAELKSGEESWTVGNWLDATEEKKFPNESGISADESAECVTTQVKVLETNAGLKVAKAIIAELENGCAADMFRKQADVILKKKFSSTANIYESKSDYLSLPAPAIRVILSNPKFKTDSENTVFTILMIWVRHSLETRQKDFILWRLLDLVDFSLMSRYYLLSIIKSTTVDKELNDELRDLIYKRYLITLENLIVQDDLSLRKNRIYDSLGDKVGMRVEFRKISSWVISEKYYSQPVHYRGYSFYFFMVVSVNKIEDSSFLAGYLRCVCDATKITSNYLPAVVTFEVILSNSKSRKLQPIPVTFDNFDRSIGTKMSQPGENWDMIKEGKSDMVKDDKITVIIHVDFQNNGRDDT